MSYSTSLQSTLNKTLVRAHSKRRKVYAVFPLFHTFFPNNVLKRRGRWPTTYCRDASTLHRNARASRSLAATLFPFAPTLSSRLDEQGRNVFLPIYTMLLAKIVVNGHSKWIGPNWGSFSKK